ncbi:MAG: hypothetical protein FJ009_22090 [Chloroflexi bacterium]|nr:hypothetical protein [Chloroflexota bacterium]
MTLTRKPTKRSVHRVTRKPKYPILDTRQVVGRIDAMMRELETIRRQLTTLPKGAVATGLTKELFGAAGKGSRDEYDLNLDWKRFAEWQLR